MDKPIPSIGDLIINRVDPSGYRLDSIQEDARNIAKNMARIEQNRRGNANVMHECLMKEISIFESSLSEDEEIAGHFASFGKDIFIKIKSVGYRNPYMLIFNGENVSDGSRATFAQHVSQMNVMFCAVKVVEGEKPRRIGFNVGGGDE